MSITESNPDGLKNLRESLESLKKIEGKAGWFPSAKYEDGTPVAAVAQWNEFGVPSRSIPARPFMRPAVEANRQKWNDLAEGLAASVLDGSIKAYQAMETLTLVAGGDILKAIVAVTSPPLSPITLMARKYKKQGKAISGKVIGEIAGKIAAGKGDFSGVSDKPLNDTGYMIATLTAITESKGEVVAEHKIAGDQ